MVEEDLSRTLGEFINFPPLVHGSVRATYSCQPDIIQQCVIRAFHKLNGLQKTYAISVSGQVGMYEGEVRLEIGVADGIYFDYLQAEVVEKLSESVELGTLYPILDFLIIVTYYYNRQDRTIHVNFDYHQLRFVFNNEWIEMRLFHSKGIRRMPIDELIKIVLDAINLEMKERSLTPLTIREFKVI
jgi:hypothetical protein